MAGSRVWRPYTATIPTGAGYSIEIDESNARATYNGQVLVPSTGALTGFLKPGSLRLRTVTGVQVDSGGKIRRKFVVADPVLWQTIASDANAVLSAPYSADVTDASGGTSTQWQVVYANAEKYTRRPHIRDTGLIDGTAGD